jgi:prepilin-type N-terminal cleavage/methylation domain-containing protein
MAVLSFYLQKKFQAFTLVELLVSISIMAIVLGISFSGGPQAIMRLTLSDNAYRTEILLREAQLQGSAVVSVSSNYGGAGVYFDLATTSEAVKFRDRIDLSITHPIGIGNGLYDQALGNEYNEVVKTVNRHRIGVLCVATSTNPLLCNDELEPDLKTLTISFSRPRQNANIYINDSKTTNYDIACVQLDSLRTPVKGYVRSILIYKSGMIVKKIDTCKA